MTPQLLITYIIGFLAVAAGTWAEYTRVLMMMQQNSYRPERYMRWLRSSGDTTSYPRIAGFLVLFGAMAAFTIPVWGMILMAPSHCSAANTRNRWCGPPACAASSP